MLIFSEEVDTLLGHLDPKESGKFSLDEFTMSLERSRKSLRTKPNVQEEANNAKKRIEYQKDPKLHEVENYRTAFGKQMLSKSVSLHATL